MARLCKACRQRLDGDPRLHDCPAEDVPDGPEDEYEEPLAAIVSCDGGDFP